MTEAEQLPEKARREERPEPVRRLPRSRIITSDTVPGANSVLKGAVASFDQGFARLFRVDDTARRFRFYSAPGYGGADSVVGIASAYGDALVAFVHGNAL